LVAQNLLIYLHDNVQSRSVIIARCTRLHLLGFRLMAVRARVGDTARVVVLTLTFLQNEVRARGGDLSLTFVLAFTLLLLELLCDCANLD
jgi:hypothetical protein